MNFKHFVFFCLFLLVFSFQCFCEGTWVKKYECGIVNPPRPALVLTGDGKCIIGGSTSSGWSSTYFPILLELDKWGNVLKGKILRQSANIIIASIQPSEEGGLFLTCYDWDSTSRSVIVLKTDAKWNILWQKTLPMPSYFAVCSSSASSDGGITVLGTMKDEKLFTLKVDKGGDIEWQHEYRNQEYYFIEGSSIHQIKNGGYAVAGILVSRLDESPRAFVIKLNEEGEIGWQKIFIEDVNEWEGFVSYCQPAANDGLVLVTGTSCPVVAKLGASGNIEWQNKYFAASDVKTYGMEPTFDGGLILLGSFMGDVDHLWDMFLLRLDQSGNVLWSKTYGRGYDEFSTTVGELPDDSILISGVEMQPDWGAFLAIKTDESGNLDSDCEYISEFGFQRVDANLNEENAKFSAFPGSLTGSDGSLYFEGFKGPEKTICSDLIPCSIEKISKLPQPFRLKIKGENFHKYCKVYIGSDTTPWNDVSRESPNVLILKKGESLKSKFPKGRAVMITVVNDDGGMMGKIFIR
jgi:hypothetical protein